MFLEKELIVKFQCPGCVHGGGGEQVCDNFTLQDSIGPDFNRYRCERQVPGTRVFPGGLIYLGLPKGFNKVGARSEEETTAIWLNRSLPTYDDLNIPVWALEEQGFLFVRMYQPRINRVLIDIIPNKKLNDLCPISLPINVSNFYDEID